MILSQNLLANSWNRERGAGKIERGEREKRKRGGRESKGEREGDILLIREGSG